MKKYKVLIVDADRITVDSLKEVLKGDVRFSVVGEALNLKAGKKLLLAQRPDLLFFGMEWADCTSGMDWLRDFRNNIYWDLKVVFCANYNVQQLQLIRKSAFDYLLKPFKDTDITDILDRFVSYRDQYNRSGLIFASSIGQSPQTFIINTATNDMRALHPFEIGFFRYSSEQKQWEIILHNQPPLILRRGITAEQITQYSPSFIQIHQSCIINIDYLVLIKDNKCVLCPPFEGATELVVSKKFKKELQDRFCL